ncbi:MAG: hypothetical protein OXH84_00445 [Gammaproteobacteria bacterium]|nr:hypothetical protein [Gammaproteobacteria bacterium]
MPRKKSYTVELLNVPHYRQGEFDCLCTYYTGAMMLTTMFPRYDYLFRSGWSQRSRTSKYFSDDPLMANFNPESKGNRKSEDHRLILSRWFSQGEYIEKVTEILNRIMSKENKKTKFEYCQETGHDNTYYDTLVGSIDNGLPVMLGWGTHDYGYHAVLITGYRKRKERWLIMNDPGGNKHSEVSWDSLKKQKTSNFEVGLCNSGSHKGIRPVKRVTDGQNSVVSQWTKNGWQNIDKNFD